MTQSPTFFIMLLLSHSFSLLARGETRIPLRRAAEDKLIRANGFMGCSFLVKTEDRALVVSKGSALLKTVLHGLEIAA